MGSFTVNFVRWDRLTKQIKKAEYSKSIYRANVLELKG